MLVDKLEIRRLPGLRMPAHLFILLLPLLLMLSGCGDSPPPEQVMARAVVGARRVDLMKELGARPESSGTLFFGDPVDILARRRLFLHVRSRKGLSGWIDSRQLVREEDIRNLNELARDYRETPAMGRSRIFEPLNVHTIPNRQSPSFDQIAAGETVDVLGHRVAERTIYKPKALPEPPPTAAQRRAMIRRAEKEAKSGVPLPPPPAPLPPRLPDQWLELSKTFSEETPATTSPSPAAPPGVRNSFLLRQQQDSATGPPKDAWTLIRTPSGKVGWVISGRAILDVPNEIREQIPFQRVTAAVPLGPRRFLIASLSKRAESHQFDTLRVFAWTRARSRYEVVHQDRNVIGYLPLEVQASEDGKQYQFSAVTQNPLDGKCWRHRYSFDGWQVKLLADMQVEKPKQPAAADELPPLELPESVEEAQREPTWWDRVRRRLFGK